MAGAVRSAADADASAVAAGDDPTVSGLMSLMDPTSVTTRRYDTLD